MTNTAVATQQGGALAISDQELMGVLESSLYPGASPESIKMVIGYCKAAQLDVMQKPVHIVPIWDGKAKLMRDVIMPGVGLYRTQAARSDAYAGVSEPEFGPDVTENIGGVSITYPAWCKVTVRRAMKNGNTAEFTATERWKENYAVKGGQEKSIAPNAMWQKRPYGQIAKCAEAQALRKAFPEVGSAPTADEMEGKQFGDDQAIDGEVIRDEPKQKQATAKPECNAETFWKNMAKVQGALTDGSSTPEYVIEQFQKRYTLTADQLASIRTYKKSEAPAEGMTFARVADALNKAGDTETLDVRADLIRQVSDEQQRAELADMYRAIRDKMMEE